MAAIDEVLVDRGERLTRVALVAGGRLVELFPERTGEPALLGAVVLGRVIRVDPAVDAAFVEIGESRPGFLPAGAARFARAPRPPRGAPISACVTEGEAVLIQLVREAIDGKGPELTTRIRLEGRFLVLTPGAGGITMASRIDPEARARLAPLARRLDEAGIGAILRSAAAGAAEEEVAAEAAHLTRRWQALLAARAAATPPTLLRAGPGALEAALAQIGDTAPPRVVLADWTMRRRVLDAAPWLEPCIEMTHEPGGPFRRYYVEEQISDAREPRVALPGAGELVIEETEALCAIDVNAGAGDPLAVNLAAAGEVPWQLRLRGLGGLILIDFLRLDQRAERDRVRAALETGAARDRVAVQLLGWTRGGLFELIRSREGPSLARKLAALERVS